MTIATLIFLGLTLISLTLFSIFYIKQNNLLIKISSFSIFPLSGTLNILLLANYLPDSTNIIYFTGITYILLSVAVIMLFIETKLTAKIIADIFYLLSAAIWIHLFQSVLYIFKVPAIFTVLLMIIYAALFITICILSGKQKKQFYPIVFISIGIVTALHFYSTVYLCFGHDINSIVLFLGATVYCLLTVFYILDHTKYHFKKAKLLKLIFLFAAQTMIAYSNVLLLK